MTANSPSPLSSGRDDGTGRDGPVLTAIQHLSATVSLAVPAILARSGIQIMLATDTLMVGQARPQDLAALGLSIPIQSMLLAVAIGVLQGQLVLTAQTYGAGRWQACGMIWRTGLVHALVIGLAFGGLALLGEPALLATGQAETLAAQAGRVLAQVAWGLPAMLFYLCCSYFMEGIQRPRVGMLIMMVAVVLNGVLNAMVLAQGGSAVDVVAATSVVRWFLFLALLGYILTLKDRAAFGVFGPLREVVTRRARYYGAMIRRIGFPAALGFGLETSTLAALVLMAGRLGADTLAAFHVSTQLMQICYMAAIGTAAAAAIRVGAAFGRRDPVNLRGAGWVGVGLGMGLMTLLGGIFIAVPASLAGLFVDESAPDVIAEAARILRVIGVLLVTNGAMIVLLGILRGMRDVWGPLILQMVSFWLVTLPMAYFLAFRVDLGAPGLAYGALAGTSLAALLLMRRFAMRAPRPTSAWKTPNSA